MGGGVVMVSLVAKKTAGLGRNELPGGSTRKRSSQFAGRCGGGVSEPGLVQDGDGTDLRTGRPAVIRGRRKQYRSSSEWYLGEGVGCGRAHREVRQWGSKPEQVQDGRRG